MNRPRHSGPRMRRNRRRGRGVAAIELALCLPILLMITWITIAACDMINLRHSLTLASYEGARTAVVKGATNMQITEAATWVLDSRQVAEGSIEIGVPDVTQVVPGQYIDVTAVAEITPNMSVLGFTNGDMQVTTQMMKEY